jgi:hypothetical protein
LKNKLVQKSIIYSRVDVVDCPIIIYLRVFVAENKKNFSVVPKSMKKNKKKLLKMQKFLKKLVAKILIRVKKW